MMSQIVLSPFVPWAVLAVFALLGSALIGLSVWQRARGILLRIVCFAILLLVLSNPRFIQERRTPQPDIAIAVIDESPSQSIEKRAAQNEQALSALRTAVKDYPNFELREVRVKASSAEREGDGTHLFGPLEQAIADIPQNQLAGVMMITDGQVHDVPKPRPGKTGKPPLPGPIHVLLTGQRNESDRRLIIDKAPSYGLVGKEVQVVYRVEDRRANAKGRQVVPENAEVRFRVDGVEIGRTRVTVGQNHTLSVPLEHAGATVVELEVEAVPGELTRLNNRAAVSVNGVRERLRVVLISGQPHVGERTWRNLLKSDPAVDLVHFTILRPPEKNDFTPLSELSLIAFPVANCSIRNFTSSICSCSTAIWSATSFRYSIWKKSRSICATAAPSYCPSGRSSPACAAFSARRWAV
ncbi:MAG: hypothetical protein RIB59_11360 [Rhodospirillales bacterium]